MTTAQSTPERGVDTASLSLELHRACGLIGNVIRALGREHEGCTLPYPAGASEARKTIRYRDALTTLLAELAAADGPRRAVDVRSLPLKNAYRAIHNALNMGLVRYHSTSRRGVVITDDGRREVGMETP